MKTIYIVRHAKSSWDFPRLADHERPLVEKGLKRTRRINNWLLKNKIKVDMIISSHAVRASQTAQIIASAVGYPKEQIHIAPAIYHADAGSLIDQFYDVPNELESAMLVGHNPTLTNFVNHYLSDKIDWLPTSGLVGITFDTQKWEDLSLAKHEVLFVMTPKMLKNK
jgi:phosphohistidine phosphatase